MTNLPIHSYASAGGLVVHDGQVLLVRKRQVAEVRMPKGHIEPGEDRAQAAVREVREETGYAHLRVVADLGTLTAEFPLDGQCIVRHESAFLMALDDMATAPRDAKDTARFEPVWVPLADAPDLLTFETEKEFARRVLAQQAAGL